MPTILVCGSVLAASAQTIYLKMDETCMNRFEYSDGDSENPYVSYSVKTSDQQFASFDVGLESKTWVKDLPGKVSFCNSLKIDKNLVNKINDGSTEIFVVRETQTHYHLAKVDKANFLVTKGGTMDFIADDAEFSLNLNNPVSGINLALPGSKSAVYLDGTISYQCLKGYIIQKKETADSRSFKEYVIVPEMGIVERAMVAKTGFVDDVIRDKEYRLASIGGMQFKSVVSEVCDKVQASFYDGSTATTTNKTPSSYDQLDTKGGKTAAKPTSNNSNPCAPTNEPGFHVVQKGETLYAISRKYSVPVAQLQSWNKLSDGNVISLCQRLIVGQAGIGSTGPATTGTTTNSGTTTNTNTDSGAGFWNKPTAEHQVRAGETVISLAKMYGYTEERFRKMNGLSATETLRVGQRLRTSDCNCPTLETSTKDSPMPYEQPTEVIGNNSTTTATTTSTPKAIDNKDVYYRPITVHLVKSTDTWFSIAKQYNTSVERILELNGMTKDDKLATDQRVYVQ
ncbi:MAG: LysM peptidoglycan-binding domain-containing protein [Saprospiraceae bacterium]|nr:LysM peptidoglycan-binding domain-containing protein [Saprospiraceae bacterium]